MSRRVISVFLLVLMLLSCEPALATITYDRAQLYAAWSPDENTVIVAEESEGYTADLYTYDLRTKKKESLASSGETDRRFRDAGEAAEFFRPQIERYYAQGWRKGLSAGILCDGDAVEVAPAQFLTIRWRSDSEPAIVLYQDMPGGERIEVVLEDLRGWFAEAGGFGWCRKGLKSDLRINSLGISPGMRNALMIVVYKGKQTDRYTDYSVALAEKSAGLYGMAGLQCYRRGDDKKAVEYFQRAVVRDASDAFRICPADLIKYLL